MNRETIAFAARYAITLGAMCAVFTVLAERQKGSRGR